METKLLLNGTSGLHIKLDNKRIRYNPDAGVSDLQLASNITIDNSGGISRRLGWNLLTAGSFHSIWCEGGDCFCIYETASYASIMKVANDLSVSGVRSGLTKNKPMYFKDIEDATYYSNGFEKGKIIDGVSDFWVQQEYKGVNTSRSWVGPPTGTHMDFHMGRLFIAHGTELKNSELHMPGLYDAVRCMWPMVQPITMVKACPDVGLFVSTTRATYFLRGTNALDFEEKMIANYPAHEGSVATDLIEVDDLELREEGYGSVWSSPRGICMGLPSGKMVNLTKERLNYPRAYTKGASLVCGYHVINTIY